ncbi:MAG: M48 family metalloprotease [Desulfamplus sp.]|nr:M48 family metalloprotease [Desulfamplus sp.]
MIFDNTEANSDLMTRRDVLNSIYKYSIAGVAMLPISALLNSCQTMNTVGQVGAQIGVASGLISSTQAESIQKVAAVTSKTFEDFTPEQEYYIGRSVGAMILQKYRPYTNQATNQYINLLGQSLAMASDRPQTYGGYHFLIQDSQEINALAAPGGFIFITRGLLRCCKSEDALASVLAHEVAHVQEKHGIQAIEKSRITSALTTIGIEGAKSFGSAELANLTRTFESSISDITTTLINNGYSKSFEKSADINAITTLKRVGYDPNGLLDMLAIMKQRLVPGKNDFGQTHPTPDDRIAVIEKQIGSFKPVISPNSRQKRFDRAMKNI